MIHMSIFNLVKRSLRYYWKAHLAVISGVAISTMVLTGTLIVGDSVQYSLEKTVDLRLGRTAFLFSGIDRFFRASLAEDIKKELGILAAPVLHLNGIASSQGGSYKLNEIQVLGIDQDFDTFINYPEIPGVPSQNGAYISENLSNRLQIKEGDAFLLRVEKASDIPKNAPFVSDENNYISLRLTVEKILKEEQLGRFNLKASQTAPLNVFLSLAYLNNQMDWPQKANKILFGEKQGIDESDILTAIGHYWKLEDLALEIIKVNDNKDLEVKSGRVFMNTIVVDQIKEIDPGAREILTYMVNQFRHGDTETPYSFISAGPFEGDTEMSDDDMIINQWLADDLGVTTGDSVEISYFIIGPLRELEVRKEKFLVRDVVPIQGIYAEQELMPDLPGLTDAGNCRDWETGVPVALDKIRDKDEDYWKEYRGTPKAFISYEKGQILWENRFGNCTSVRLSQDLDTTRFKNELAHKITPGSLGFTVTPVMEAGLTAARGGVDFAQLFMGLSFFLLAAGIILMALLFNLHLEQRMTELGTLKALGYPIRLIRKMVLTEGFLLALPGVIAGSLLAIVYNKLIFKALNTVWYDIIRTSQMQEDVRLESLVLGTTIALIIVYVSLWYNIKRKLRGNISGLQKSQIEIIAKGKGKLFLHFGWLLGVLALSLLVYDTLFSQILNAGLFFTAGTLLLLSVLLMTTYWSRAGLTTSGSHFSVRSLIFNNLFRNRARSLRIIILFSLGTFIVISTGLNKKDHRSTADLPESGTGGFLFFMETTLPVLRDLNDPDVRLDRGIDKELNFIQLRKNEGDDASCLNLNLVSSPRILGIPSESLSGRFSFVKQTTDVNPADPWVSLKKELDDGVLPAIADQTVIQWGLGKKIGDTLVYNDEYGKELKLKLVGGLANSIFQGNVLIDEGLFLKHFPSSSGTNIFLVDGDFQNKEGLLTSMERAFRNDGLDIELASDRLGEFNKIENTYLSIFLLLGGLAMILGTIGLGISLARNIIDRRKEIGILQAVGFTKGKIVRMLSLEHALLLILGTLSGSITAYIATLPSILSSMVDASWLTALIIIFVILANGYFWIFLITRQTLVSELARELSAE